MSPLLRLDHISVGIGPLNLLDDISLSLDRGQILGLVGESG